jgi:hypothetical protein
MHRLISWFESRPGIPKDCLIGGLVTQKQSRPSTLLTVIGERRLVPKPPIGTDGCNHRDEYQTGDYYAGRPDPFSF